MKKDEFIARYSEVKYQRMPARVKAWNRAHPEKVRAHQVKRREEHREELTAYSKRYKEEHPEERAIMHSEQCRKNGKRYRKTQIYNHTGLQGERNKIRYKHAIQWRKYKEVIAPKSQCHHQWCPQSASYTGLALCGS